MLLAGPLKAIPELGQSLGRALAGKVVLDATNPYPDRDGELARHAVCQGHGTTRPINDEPNTAFGGEKASGLGRFGGRWAIEEFTTEHWISVQEQPRPHPL
ncbi:MAG: hypothetical protein JOZ69_01140 [Myxococcales bacterium]|nr:hypothetical protein [Myxococcales bacterium]